MKKQKGRVDPLKKAKPDYYTVGVRFLDGQHVSRSVYTYRIKLGAKVHLGQELVADTEHGSDIVAVVRIDPTRQDTNPNITYKYLTRKVVPL